MTMLDRYLYAIQIGLPKDALGSDIIAEIRDELRSQIDEPESELGRTLTDDEEAALLKAYGHPRIVAGRYSAVQYLVGPEFLPFYWSTLTLIVTIVVALELVAGGIAAIATHNGMHFFEGIGAAWNSLFCIFAIVTLSFALAERTTAGRRSIGFSARWDPRRLPAPGALAPVPRTSSIAEFIANFLALLVVLDAPGPHRIPLDTAIATVLQSLHLTFTPAWHAAYLAAIASTALLAASAIAVFVQPRLGAVHEAVRGASSLVLMAGIHSKPVRGSNR
ncbi:MAG TPA: hypothetical protein VKT72_04785 [Candidatus Baltobacteraceae bacterium]|nr:hypothetical protein [Candidatus Baltobacteraceae bacterium]